MKGLAIKVLKISKRAPKEFQLSVEWYRKDEKTNKWASMDIQQDMVVNTETFEKEWKELN